MIKPINLLNKLQVLKLHFQKLGLISTANYITQRIYKPRNGLLKVLIPGYKHPVYLRNIQSDIQIFTQIFLREELKIDLLVVPKIIIDGGANIGFAALYLKNRYPDAAIFSIEPDDSNFKLLMKNTSQYKKIVCYNNCIWNKKAKLKIVNKDAGNESFVVAEVNMNNLDVDAINAITINEIVKQNNIVNIDLLKMDIEGSERNVFEDNYIEWLSITDNMLVEIHNWIEGDAGKMVMAAVKDKFQTKMNGEYHFFSKM